VVLVGFALAGCDDPEPAPVCTPDAGLELYEKRIAPLLEESRPSSCNTCHLAGIDLQPYATGDPCRTMACMVEEGLVSLEDPESSLVLGWIGRAEPDSALITEAVIAEEYQGFKAWIEWSAACGADVCGVIDNPCAPETAAEDATCESDELERDPSTPPYEGDPGDCSDLTIETLFRDRVFVHRGRCGPCHTQGLDAEGPDWVRAGSCNEGSLATMRRLIRDGLVDPEMPADSAILVKPLSDADGHGAGHPKFAGTDDPTYRDMLYWIQRWSACGSELSD
jgi:hypothetical protein